jgi:hypothetical protein
MSRNCGGGGGETDEANGSRDGDPRGSPLTCGGAGGRHEETVRIMTARSYDRVPTAGGLRLGRPNP